MKSEIKVGAILNYVIILLTAISGLLYTPFMLRYLGQSEYGLYMLMGSLVGYISVLDFGLHNTIYRFVAKYQNEGNNKEQENFLASCFIIYGAISILVLIVGVVLYSNLEYIFSKSLTDNEMYRAKIMFIILILNLAISLPMGAFQFIIKGYGKFVFANSIKIIRIIIRTAVMITILIIGYKAISIVIVDTIFNLSMALIYFIYCFSKLNIRINLHSFNKALFREIFYYSFFIFLLAIVNQMFWKVGQVGLGIIANTAAVAVYALSINLVLYYQKFSLGISGVFMPKVTKLVVDGATGENLTDLMVKVGRMQFSILGLALTGFIILGKQFISLWAGDDYSQTFWISLLIFIPLTVPMIQTVGGVILQVKNLHAFKAKTYLFMVVVNLIMGLFLARIYGPLGFGIATALSIFIFQIIIINLYYNYKVELNVLRFFKQTSEGLMPAMILSLFLGYITLLLPGSGWLFLVLRIILVSIIYCLSMWLIGLNKDEKKLLLKPVFRLINKKCDAAHL